MFRVGESYAVRPRSSRQDGSHGEKVDGHVGHLLQFHLFFRNLFPMTLKENLYGISKLQDMFLQQVGRILFLNILNVIKEYG